MKRIYLLTSILLFSLGGCHEADLVLYDSGAKIQMGDISNLVYTFVYEPEEVTRDTVYIPVRVIGGPSDVARDVKFMPIKVYDVTYTMDNGVKVDSTVTENPYNAVAGKHYVDFGNDAVRDLMVVQPGQVEARVPVILLRDPSLRDAEYQLKLQLIATGEFAIGGAADKQVITIVFSDKLVKPGFWDQNYGGSYYFGDYSRRKHEFMIEVSGEKIDDAWYVNLQGITGIMQYYPVLFKNALKEYNADPENIASGAAPMREIEGDPTSKLINFK